MVGGEIWRFAGQGYLYRSRAPWNEVGELSFANSEKRLMDLFGVITDKQNIYMEEIMIWSLTSVGSTSPWMILRMEM